MSRASAPTGAEDRLILLSAGTAARREAAGPQAQELTSAADWSLLADLLERRRLLTLLGPRIVELTNSRDDAGLAGRLGAALDMGRRQAVFQEAIAERVLSALRSEGIAASVLKGPALSDLLYGDPGRRPSTDIDVLVCADRLQDAVRIVRALGYYAPTDYVEEGGRPLLHFALVHERGQLPPVELHWRIHWYEQSFASQRLLPPVHDVDIRWRPEPIYDLAALLLFYARDGFVGLRLATDIAAYWDEFGESLPRGALDRVIDEYPALRHALLAAASVAEKLVGLPLDEITQKRPTLNRRDRVAARLATPTPPTSTTQAFMDIGLVDGLLAPRGGFTSFVRRQVFPPREVLQEHAQKSQRTRASTSVGHGARVLGRYGLALTRLAHRRGAPVA
jgi:putative nucleotidyltransferase-like protein